MSPLEEAVSRGHEPDVDTLEDARFWIRVMHRRTVADAERMNRIEDRLRDLEHPWRKRRTHP